jgi:predicted transcriptional regulator
VGSREAQAIKQLSKWALPRDYPMAVPNYAATRSQRAKKIGLGKSPAKPPISPKAAGAAKRRAPREAAYII